MWTLIAVIVAFVAGWKLRSLVETMREELYESYYLNDRI